VELEKLEPYAPQDEASNLRLLRFCWLPRGVWRLNVRGGLPPANDIHLSISQGGEIRFKTMLNEQQMQNLDVSLEFHQKKYADPLFLSVKSYEIGLLDPLRQNAVEMEAVFVREL
jgi:hypothetical protein